MDDTYYQVDYETTTIWSTDTFNNNNCSFRIIHPYLNGTTKEMNTIIYNDDEFILQLVFQGCNNNHNFNRDGYFIFKQTTNNPKLYLNEINL